MAAMAKSWKKVVLPLDVAFKAYTAKNFMQYIWWELTAF